MILVALSSDISTHLSTTVLGCTLMIALCIFLYLRSHRHDNQPPLVPGVPLLGNILNVSRTHPHLSLSHLVRDHGDIYQIKILKRQMIVVSSRSLIQEVLCDKKNVFAGRPEFFRLTYGFHNAKDIIFGNYDQKWVTMKKITSQLVRQFAGDRTRAHFDVRDDIETLVRCYDDTEGGDFDPSLYHLTAVVNAISAAMTGRRMAMNDPQMILYKKTTRLFSRACSITEGVELDMFPWLRFLPNESFRRLKEARSLLDQFVDRELEIKKREFDPDNIDCILDALIQSTLVQKYDTGDLTADTKRPTNDASHPEGETPYATYDTTQGSQNTTRITETDIRAIFIDIFVSGTFTTSVALSALVLTLTHDTALQRRLQAEIDNNIGANRLPEVGDRNRMHLMEASILEILRYISHVPLCLPHMALDDATIGTYNVERGTEILLNLWHLHHNPEVFPDPWHFRPQRFLDDTGRLLPPTHESRRSHFAFSSGRRMCIGEQLSRDRIFLYITAILQKFSLLPPEDSTLQSCDPRDFQLGLILEPPPFQIRAQRRQ